MLELLDMSHRLDLQLTPHCFKFVALAGLAGAPNVASDRLDAGGDARPGLLRWRSSAGRTALVLQEPALLEAISLKSMRARWSITQQLDSEMLNCSQISSVVNPSTSRR